MALEKPFLQIEKLSLAFGGILALKDLSLILSKGGFYSIIGPNGAGKTSLLNCINGQYRPQSGRILFEGQDLSNRTPYEIARMGVARTFQRIELFSYLSVLDNVKLGRHFLMHASPWSCFLRLPGMVREEFQHRRELDEEVIDFLGLSGFRNHLVASLPHGIRKRVDLARALAMKPKCSYLMKSCPA